MRNYTLSPPEEMIFERAIGADAEDLSSLAQRSKRHWGYVKETMDAWNENLTLTSEFIKNHTVIKGVIDEEIIGFFSLDEILPTTRIIHFWIDTPYLRKGYGSNLYSYMIKFLKDNKVEKATLVIDPNSQEFFEKMGGSLIKKIEFKVKNRFLLIMGFSFN